MSKIFLLLSHERSGSHLVGDYIGSLDNYRMVDEVCNPNAVRPAKHAESFHRFKYDYLIRDPAFMLEPSVERLNEFLAGFFDHLARLRATHDIVVDIKYGHVQNFEWWWCPPLVRPFLFNFCQNRNIGLLHLYRSNVVEATVSAMIADKRKVWHSWQAGAEADGAKRFALPAAEVVRRAKLLQGQTQLFKDWTIGTRKLEFTYEYISPLLDAGAVEDGGIGEFLGAASAKFKLRHQKVTPPLQAVVENFDELKQECEKDGLGWCVS
ncbi:MAG: hypothetical protein JOZ13_15595 [Alphaproteobacteria bacterium]|nr:hypothetical protein [Alphaproteobacteria bacterium]